MYRNYFNIVSGELKEKLRLRKSTNDKKGYKRVMQSEYVKIHSLPVRVDSWGGYLPSRVLEKTQEKPKELILMIPGNPGVTKFYEQFLDHLYEKTRKPIWILSHGGHDQMYRKFPPVQTNQHLYNLQGQIEQKKKFIDTYLEGVTLYCIGHSIGCKMLMEILKDEKRSKNIEKCFMLFPTLERMFETPNGHILASVVNYWLWLIFFLSRFFVLMPDFMQDFLLRVYCIVCDLPHKNIHAMRLLVDPHVLNKVLFLAKNELETVKELDKETLIKNRKKIKLYYGVDDGWTPVKFYRELMENFDNIDAELSSMGFKHAFVLKQSKEVAELVSVWINRCTRPYQ